LSTMGFDTSITVKKAILIITLLFAAILLFRLVPQDPNQGGVAERLQKWNVSMHAPDFALVDFIENRSGGVAKATVEAEGEDTILKITRIKTDAPQKYIDDKKFLLESLFLPTTSPYPGVITNIRECPEEFKPTVQTMEQGLIYTLFAGPRFNYGVCAQDLVEYYSAYGIFDCKEKGVFEVRVFSKVKENVQPFVGSFTCV